MDTNVGDTFSDFHVRSVAHQALLASLGVRTSQGSFYTPLEIAEQLVHLALAERIGRIKRPEDCPRVLDPSCGTGNFLVVVALQLAEKLTQLGMSQSESLQYVVQHCIYGTDIDASAIEVCKQNLLSLCSRKLTDFEIGQHIAVVDSLRLFLLGGGKAGQGSLFDEPEKTWSDLFPDVFEHQDSGFDVVVGNPPFLNQLESETSLASDLATALIDRFGSALSKLTNTASIFMLGSSEIVVEGGIITMIQPISFLATRESFEIRQLLLQRGALTHLWFGGGKIFDAAVEVVGITLVIGRKLGLTAISVGREFETCGLVESPKPNEQTWSRPLARSRGVPQIDFKPKGVIGDFASATADFRDQYYGLVGAVRELATTEKRGDLMRLATVGLIDVADFMWGKRTTRFAKEKFERPVVDLSLLSAPIRVWADSRSKPKIIVSNQTKVLEAFVDVSGEILPSVPLLTVDCDLEQLWLVAAAISSPITSVIAAERHLGAGMSVDVIKLSAKDLLNLPAPSDFAAWDKGSKVFKQLQDTEGEDQRMSLLSQFAMLMCLAYGVTDVAVSTWWLKRLPVR